MSKNRTPPPMNPMDLIAHGPVIPVIVLQRVQDAVPLAEALLAGGVRVLEVTLRSPVALACIQAIARNVPEALVGAGTLRSVADAEHMADVVRQGRSLAVFPEGTFVDRPGLLPFHLGAFMAAANAAVPVVPVVIRGHRELLPAGRWWPRHTALAVEIHAAMAPPDAAVDLFAGAVSLRQAARRVIAAGVKDPAAGWPADEAA